MSIFIHILEALAALFFVAMVVQIRRAYKAEVSLQQAQAARDQAHLDIQAEAAVLDLSAHLDAVSLIVDEAFDEGRVETTSAATSFATRRPVVDAPQKSKPEIGDAGTSQILGDYIGGFFSEATVPEIKEFKAVSYSEASKIVSSNAVNEDLTDAKIDIRPFKAVSVEQDEIPVLETRIPEELLTDHFVTQRDELDGEVIVVEELEQQHASAKNVMSDKVVLAMLGEAKLASTN
jgi:hypothetical protein